VSEELNEEVRTLTDEIRQLRRAQRVILDLVVEIRADLDILLQEEEATYPAPVALAVRVN